MLSLGVVGANLMLVLVINSRRYSKYIHEQVGTHTKKVLRSEQCASRGSGIRRWPSTPRTAHPRYLLTSLASNDLAIGLLVTPFALVPSVNHCWPFGEIACQI
ncbi:hypothetical protein FOCC_FOCC007363, partial [Frankliniella occidentalis]